VDFSKDGLCLLLLARKGLPEVPEVNVLLLERKESDEGHISTQEADAGIPSRLLQGSCCRFPQCQSFQQAGGLTSRPASKRGGTQERGFAQLTQGSGGSTRGVGKGGGDITVKGVGERLGAEIPAAYAAIF